MSTICDNNRNDTEKGDEECVIRIERTRVSRVNKIFNSLANCVPLVNGWPLLCIYTIILGIASLSMAIYLKAMGEWTPFCLYDNWYYMAYYVLLSIFGATLIPLSDFDMFSAVSPFWRWARRFGAYVLFMEFQGFAYVVVFFNDIAYDIEYDDEAQVVVWAMGTLGALRFINVSIAYLSAVKCLTRVQRRNKLPFNQFGKTYTDLSDILVTELVLMSLYCYGISLYNIAFVLSSTYLYITWARI